LLPELLLLELLLLKLLLLKQLLLLLLLVGLARATASTSTQWRICRRKRLRPRLDRMLL
jgi:hypothetical protein